MAAKVDEGFCVYGAAILARQLQALTGEAEGVREAVDIEFVHRMRVASRRLRAALPLFKPCFPAKSHKKWLRQVRRITRALGAARDTDVQLDLLTGFRSSHPEPVYQPGLRRLSLRLSQQRKHLQTNVLEQLDSFDNSGIVADLQEHLSPLLDRQGKVYLYTPYLYLRAYEAVSARMEEFLDYEQYIERPECVTELHAMRIAAKRLRYTLEIFAPIYPGEMKAPLQAVRKVQESLGDIHDCDVWGTFLPAFLDQEHALMTEYYGHSRNFRRLVPGLQCFLEDRQQKREKEYQSFLAYWKKTREQGIWPEILNTIRIPYYQGEQPPGLQKPGTPAVGPAPAAADAQTQTAQADSGTRGKEK